MEGQIITTVVCQLGTSSMNSNITGQGDDDDDDAVKKKHCNFGYKQ